MSCQAILHLLSRFIGLSNAVQQSVDKLKHSVIIVRGL